MTAADPDGLDYNAIIRNRLRQALHDIPQAEVARRTNTSPNNVSRYFAGRRMPVEFCAAVVNVFDINPTWLFTGHGAPKISQQPVETRGQTSDLMELVQSMQAVMKLRIGELAGKAHLKELRRLNEAIERYHELRERVNEHFRPIFKDLLDTYDGALKSMDLVKAEGMRNSLRQVARMSDDDMLHWRLNSCESTYAIRRGDTEGAVDFGRRAFMGALTLRTGRPSHLMSVANNHAINLIQAGRLREAESILTAAIGTVFDSKDEDVVKIVWFARFLRSVAVRNLGRIDEATTECILAYRNLSDFYRPGSRPSFMEHMTLAGVAPLKERLDAGLADSPVYMQVREAQSIALLVSLLDDLQALERARKAFTPILKDGEEENAHFMDAYSDAQSRALQGDRNTAKDFDASSIVQRCKASPDPLSRLRVDVALAHIQLLLNDDKNAMQKVLHAENGLDRLPDGISMPLLPLARHKKTIVQLGSRGSVPNKQLHLRQSAVEFFNQHIESGFVFFRKAVSADMLHQSN